MKKVYLTGGMHTDWQERVKVECNLIYHDPMNHKFSTFEKYGCWDLAAIRSADIVFAYGENTNPGTGYLMELAYAKGLGKTVILVLEKNNNHISDRYLKFAELFADYATDDLSEGIDMLKSFEMII